MNKTYWLIQKDGEVLFLCETPESAHKTFDHYTDYLLREAADTLSGTEMLEEIKKIIAMKDFYSIESISALKEGACLFGYGYKIYPKSVWRDNLGYQSNR